MRDWFTRLGVLLLATTCALAAATSASAQDVAQPRAVLEQAAQAMGGLERLRSLHNVVMTGFGQRVYFQGGGFITGEEPAQVASGDRRAAHL